MANLMWGGRKYGAHDIKSRYRVAVVSEAKDGLSSPRCRHSEPERARSKGEATGGGGGRHGGPL